MERNTIDEIKRYVRARRGSGVDVGYRIASGTPSGASATRPDAAPPKKAREIVMITSPVTRSTGAAVEQTSLFEGAARKPSLDLSGCDLAATETLVAACERCRLAAGRTRTVFGSGNPSSKIVFIGEAPGRDEDLQGLPFVGRAGQLLTKMLAAIGFARDDVYITNILKCRPPQNREPQEDEMAACEPYLRRQLEIISPLVICALGRIAAHGLLKTTTALGVLRKGVHYYNDIPVAVVYHPAALLRNPNLKRDAWEDLQKMRKLYDERSGEGE